MAVGIAEHRNRRDGRLHTVEAPLDLPAAITAHGSKGQAVLIDWLTLWLSNVILARQDSIAELQRLVAALNKATGPVVVVSNEAGFGIVPDNALARKFRYAQGRGDMHVAAIAGLAAR